MSFPKYPEYKDSGVEWLGSAPANWTAGKLRWLATIYSGGTPDKKNEDYWTDGTIPWLNSGAVNQQFITEPSTYITKEALENSSAKWVPANALVIALAGQGKTKGMVAQLALSATCNQSMAAIIPSANLDARYLLWWLATNYQHIRNLAGGDLRDGLNLQLLGTIGCPIPSKAEQKAIAAFLDDETSKIDSLIAEQRRLIELLKEKRQAVISHAVTKGLNPDAPMKPSGIEWLGDVPEHWEIGKVKHYFDTCSGGTPNTAQQSLYYAEEGEGHAWVRTTDLNNDLVNSVPVYITDLAIKDTACEVLPAGTVMIAMYGGAGTVGKNGLLMFPAAINQAVCGLLPCSTHNSAYVFRFMQYYRPYWMIGAESSRKDPNISQDHVKNAPFPKLPIEEQDEIVNVLNETLETFNGLLAEAQRAINLLQERRTALISAAVTGKIDVRNYKKSERKSEATAQDDIAALNESAAANAG